MLAWPIALWQDESGQDLTEYALLVALLAIVVIAALRTLGPTIGSLYSDIGQELSTLGGVAEATCCD